MYHADIFGIKLVTYAHSAVLHFLFLTPQILLAMTRKLICWWI